MDPVLPPTGERLGSIIWLTGLSGSGKTTIATAMEHRWRGRGRQTCVLDGDGLRAGVNSDLGFSPTDRAENARRVAEMAKLLAHSGLTVIVALISPFEKDRRMARETVTASGVVFVEVYLDCPLSICEQRDPKGLYRKARAGQIAAFTGVDAGYETPRDPEVILPTGSETPEESISRLDTFLRDRLGF